MRRLKKANRTRESATADYSEWLTNQLKDPTEAIEYLNAAFEYEDHEGVLLALRDVANAQGISQVAERSGLNRENLYRILSPDGNPRLSSFLPLLRSLGIKLTSKNQETVEERTSTTICPHLIHLDDYRQERKSWTAKSVNNESESTNSTLASTA